jgi:arylsulfatase A-like enzyme
VIEGRGLALREGEWKFLQHPNPAPVQSLTYEKAPGQFELFNLADDPGETVNRIDEEPQRAEQMKARLEAIRQAGRSR